MINVGETMDQIFAGIRMETYWSLEQTNHIYEEIRNGHRGVAYDTLDKAGDVIVRGIWANTGDEAVSVATEDVIRTVLIEVEYD